MITNSSNNTGSSAVGGAVSPQISSSTAAVAAAATTAAARKAATAKGSQSLMFIASTDEPSDYGLLDMQSRRILRVSELIMRLDQLRFKLRHEHGVEVSCKAGDDTVQWQFEDGSPSALPSGMVLPPSFKQKRRDHELTMAALQSSSSNTNAPAAAVGIKRRRSTNKSASQTGKSELPSMNIIRFVL